MPPINWVSVVKFLLPYAVVACLSWLAGSYITGLSDAAAQAVVAENHAKEVTGLNARIHELELAVADYNKATEVAKARGEAADKARQQAEQHAADLAAFSKSRMDRLDVLVKGATSCRQVLDGYWEERKR